MYVEHEASQRALTLFSQKLASYDRCLVMLGMICVISYLQEALIKTDWMKRTLSAMS